MVSGVSYGDQEDDMLKSFAAVVLGVAALATLLFAAQAPAPPRQFTPVTQKMLESPSPDDWLMFSRTYDAQRFSPLKQITRQNVTQLKSAWTVDLANGTTETIPIVHDGVMYLATPGASVRALDATTGATIWEYKRTNANGNPAGQSRTKSLAIYQDVILYTAPDAHVVGIDARTGEMRWQTKVETRGNTSGPIVVEGKVISGGACSGNRNNCFISAHDALTGKEVWRFYTTPGIGEPGDETWGGAALNNRQASTWGLPGSFDPVRRLIYWSVANPMPDQRSARHGTADAVPRTAPVDLYSNSTLALNPDTGKLSWYYQHLPGDDWDSDYTHERTLARTRINPDPRFVKWINPDIQRGPERDVVVAIGEAGGIFVLDAADGRFLWAHPFPFDAPEWGVSSIDPKTGKTTLNWDLVFKQPGDRKIVCYWNTRSYWPTSYSPTTNSIYIPYTDNCRDVSTTGPAGRGSWKVVPRPGSNPNELTGLAKINLSTGELLRFSVGRVPSNGGVLTTAGDLVFHGDMSGKFRAFDAANGKQLWETALVGNVSVSTITYAVRGKQYVAVMTGDNLKVPELLGEFTDLKTERTHNAIYVFALP
jgi:alcohol dehydrogenase (cytochrome c)